MREGWSKRKIEEIATITMGQSPSGNSINEINGMEFHQGKIYFGEKYIKESHFYTSDPIRFAEPNSLLLCVRAPIGVVNITDRKICIGRGLCSIKANDSMLYNFLYYAILSKKEYYNKNATGSTFLAISSNVVKDTPISFPSKEKQCQIASELDKITEMISKYDEQLKELDKLSQSIFYEMFGDPVENEKGWEVKKLEEISREIGDGLHGTPVYTQYNTGYFFINGNNLENGVICIKENTKMVSEDTKCKYHIDMDTSTILVSINGTLGKTAIYNGENVILGKSACYIKLNSDVNKVYIHEIIKSDYFKKYANDESTGTTIKNVSLKSMRHFPIILPPLPLQQSFARKIEAIEAMKSKVREAKKEAETLLAARMQYWFE